MSKSRQREATTSKNSSDSSTETSRVIEQVVKDSIPPADSIVVPGLSISDPASAPSADTVTPSSSPAKTDEPKRPSEVQLAVLALGSLNGNDRTQELNRLRHQFGGLKVEDTIADFIRLGFMDEGQVLTAKGTLTRMKFQP